MKHISKVKFFSLLPLNIIKTYKERKMKIKCKDKKKKSAIVFRLYKVIIHYFPDLLDKQRGIKDYRKKSEYELAFDILTFSLNT